MMKKEVKIYFLLAALLTVNLFFILFIGRNIYPIHLAPQNILASDLIGITTHLPNVLISILGLGNLIFLWLISKRFFKGYAALIVPAIYAISPWSSYLTAAGSFYVFLLFLLMVFTYSLILIRDGSSALGAILFLASSLTAVYSSVFFLILIPLYVALVILFKIIPTKNIKKLVVIFAFLIIPIIFLILKNATSFKNVVKNEITVFKDPGLVNTANQFQGEAEKSGLKILARLSENKYLFYSETLLLKYTDQLVPVTFFTPQYKLLNFSFTPPIFLGFLIPFLYGFYLSAINPNTRKFLYMSTLFVVPSVLAKNIISLDRLVLFLPVVIFIIVWGLIHMFELKKRKLIKCLLALSFVLVIFQLLVTMSDIKTREKLRFESYYGNKYEITEQ